MSERPTISIYHDDQAVEIYYYRNWNGFELLEESCKLLRMLDGSRSWQEARMRLEEAFRYEASSAVPDLRMAEGIDPKTSRLLAMCTALDCEDASCPDSEGNRRLEYYSEFRVYIDLTRRIVYEDEYFMGDVATAVGWRDWIRLGNGSWYDPWNRSGRAFSFDDAAELMLWATVDCSEEAKRAKECAKFFDILADLRDSADELA